MGIPLPRLLLGSTSMCPVVVACAHVEITKPPPRLWGILLLQKELQGQAEGLQGDEGPAQQEVQTWSHTYCAPSSTFNTQAANHPSPSSCSGSPALKNHQEGRQEAQATYTAGVGQEGQGT